MHEMDAFVFLLMSLKGRLLETVFSIQLMAIKKETQKTQNLFPVYLVYLKRNTNLELELCLS